MNRTLSPMNYEKGCCFREKIKASGLLFSSSSLLLKRIEVGHRSGIWLVLVFLYP